MVKLVDGGDARMIEYFKRWRANRDAFLHENEEAVREILAR
jgi:hypothetical protein